MRFMTFSALLALAACDAEPGEKGDPGTDGADGTDGVAGADGTSGSDGADGTDGQGFDHAFSGTVSTSSGAAAGASVTLELLSAEGEVLSAVGGALADSNGTYTIHLADIDTPTTLMRVSAETEEGTVRALVHDTDISVNAASTAVEEIVNMIVASEGGRSLYDFDTADIGALVTSAETVLTSAGTDLADIDAVVYQVLLDIGGDIADASGGVYEVGEGIFAIESDPPDVVTTAGSGSYLYMYDGESYLWQVYTYYGYIYGYSGTTYDNYGYFYVDGDSPYCSSCYSSSTLEDDYEVVMGPSNYAPSGVARYRKVHVSPNHPYARYLEVLTNSTDEDIEVEVYWYGKLNGSSVAYEYTSSGDGTVDSSDSWFVSSNSGYGPVAAAFPGASSIDARSDGYIYVYWDDVTVPANGRVTFAHWHRQGSDTATLAKEMAVDFGSDGIPLSSDYYEGLSFAELSDHHSLILESNAVGEAGSVAPYSEITFTNATSGQAFFATAASDGSFEAAVKAVSGDLILLEATDGTSDSITIP